MSLETYLAGVEKDYDPNLHMLGTVWNGPGYHSQIPNGTWVHPTRNSLHYALLLLRSPQTDHHHRAADVIRKVLSFQETDPTRETYGIWPWLGEEPLEKMAPPDWNWADFCGSIIAQGLIEHADKLPADLLTAMRESLGHAAWSIFRRNVQPDYTNIAFMGAGVTAAAGELLNESRLLHFGRRRLERILEHTEYHGGLNEYNSPTYTFVALHECERILQLVQDAAARQSTETLRRFIWQSLTEHFHPATGQLAGPHSRAYHDYLSTVIIEYLSNQTGLPFTVHPAFSDSKAAMPSSLNHLPCPPEIVDRFRGLPEDDLEIRRRFIHREPDTQLTYGTTWFHGDVCLGSANRDNGWTQRRPLIAYWKTENDPAVVLRLRFLHDGQDFASAAIYNHQQANRVLSAISFFNNLGDFHHHLDRPEDGFFEAQDFRLRYELSGKQLSENTFELTAGDHRAVIHTFPANSVIAKSAGSSPWNPTKPAWTPSVIKVQALNST